MWVSAEYDSGKLVGMKTGQENIEGKYGTRQRKTLWGSLGQDGGKQYGEVWKRAAENILRRYRTGLENIVEKCRTRLENIVGKYRTGQLKTGGNV